jgi:hypothetical protein
MIQCSTESLLKADIKDIIFDLLEINNVSMERQFEGKDMINYRYWLKHAISYALVVEYNLTKKHRTLDLTEYTFNCTEEELLDLTNRVIINLTRSIEIYQDTPLVELLSATMFSLSMAKSYAS